MESMYEHCCKLADAMFVEKTDPHAIRLERAWYGTIRAINVCIPSDQRWLTRELEGLRNAIVRRNQALYYHQGYLDGYGLDLK